MALGHTPRHPRQAPRTHTTTASPTHRRKHPASAIRALVWRVSVAEYCPWCGALARCCLCAGYLSGGRRFMERLLVGAARAGLLVGEGRVACLGSASPPATKPSAQRTRGCVRRVPVPPPPAPPVRAGGAVRRGALPALSRPSGPPHPSNERGCEVGSSPRPQPPRGAVVVGQDRSASARRRGTAVGSRSRAATARRSFHCPVAQASPRARPSTPVQCTDPSK